MSAKHLSMWLRAATQEEDPDLVNWEKLLAIIQEAFRIVELVVSCAWKTVVMIPKGVGTEFRVISLVDVLWKAISGIINRRISSSIQFHDALHGFCAGRGMDTATLEANILQQIISMRETVLHSILIDLHKAYAALDRYRCLYMLMGYGVVPRTLHILRTYWVQLQMAPKARGHYGPFFQSHHGVTQGYPLWFAC